MKEMQYYNIANAAENGVDDYEDLVENFTVSIFFLLHRFTFHYTDVKL